MVKKRMVQLMLFSLAAFVFIGCKTSHDINHELDVKPIEIKPIHITIDVNIRVEKALDDFFDELEEEEVKIKE